MTNLETVAAQRDELSTKLRAMALQLEAALTEIGRLNAKLALVQAVQPGGTDPCYADGGFVSPLRDEHGTVHGEIPAEVVNAAGILASDKPHTVVEKLRDAMIDPDKPKPKRTGLFGKKS